MANNYLKRVPHSGGNPRTYTVSCWIKNQHVDGNGHADILHAYNGTSSNRMQFMFQGNPSNLEFWSGGSSSRFVKTCASGKETNERTFVDGDAWMHCVAMIDTPAQHEFQRCRIFVNGVEQSLIDGDPVNVTGIPQDANPGQVNWRGVIHHIMGTSNSNIASAGGSNFKGQIFDHYLVDGLALSADVFGQEKDGRWVPKSPARVKKEVNALGGFGVNGHYLPMNDIANVGFDFHTTPNSIIKLKGEDLAQPKCGAPATTDAYVSQLREDPYKDYLVLAIPGLSTSTGPNLITNGTFDDDISGWTGVDATVSWSAGRLRITANAGINGAVYQTVSGLTIGQKYTVFAECVLATGPWGRIHVGTSTDINSQNKYSETASTAAQNFGVGPQSLTFDAVATSHVIWLEVGGGQSDTFEFDNVIMKAEDAPRDYSADIKGSGTNKTVTCNGNSGVYYNIPSQYGSAIGMNINQNNGAWLDVAPSADFAINGNDYTIEMWVFPQKSQTTNARLFGLGVNGANSDGSLDAYLSGAITNQNNTGNIFYNGSTQQGTDGGGLWVEQWNHVVSMKRRNFLYTIVNGTATYVDTLQSITVGASDKKFRIGQIGEDAAPNYQFSGYICDIRVYNGVAKYDAGGFDCNKPWTPHVGDGLGWYGQYGRIRPDTCKKNFATFSQLRASSDNNYSLGGLSFTNGDLTISNSNNGNATSGTMSANSGKYYWEVRIDTFVANNIWVGVLDEDFGAGENSPKPVDSNRWITGGNREIILWGSSGTYYRGSSSNATGVSYAAGDVLGFSLDLDTFGNKSPIMTFYKNGTLAFTLNNNAAVDGNPSGYWRPAITFGGGNAGWKITGNFGQDHTFEGKYNTASYFTDANGKGKFRYQPPSDHVAWCAENLPTPIKEPKKYFDTLLWTGDGLDPKSVRGLEFRPDMVWTKERTSTSSPYLTDCMTGNPYWIATDNDAAAGSNGNWFSGFDLGGFSMGTDGAINQSGQKYVAHCWKAGGHSKAYNIDDVSYDTATAAGITGYTANNFYGISAGTTQGFSIVRYSAISGQTVPHGLNEKPKMIWIKNTSTANRDWMVWHEYGNNGSVMGSADVLNLNLGDAMGTSGTNTFITAVDADRFTVGSSVIVAENGQAFTAYCWHDVPGFSKIGWYRASGTDPGIYVETGFKPAYVLVKWVSGSQSWTIWDNKRDTKNPMTKYLHMNETQGDGDYSGTQFEFLSNGFRPVGSPAANATNQSLGYYIFAAFAEQPFSQADAK